MAKNHEQRLGRQRVGPRVGLRVGRVGRVGLLALCVWVAGLWTGCPTPVVDPPDSPAACDSSADCKDAGNVGGALGGLCADGACVACDSADDCVADSAYGEGAVCVDGRCAVCVDGEVGCACLDDQYCLAGEGCRDGLCRPCDAGDALCPCNDNDDCGDGFICSSDRCVKDDCVAGAEGCACDADGGCVDEDDVCSDGVCRGCPADVAGCPCAAGACGDDLVCDADNARCRAASSCTELVCGAARLCSESGGRAACLDECADGFSFDVDSDSCVAIRGANCDAGAPSSILAACTDQHRACVESTDADGNDTAACGACDATDVACFVGPADPAQGVCRAATTCAACDDEHRGCTDEPGCGDVVCGGCVDGFFERVGVCQPIEHVSCDVCAGVERECVADGDEFFCGNCLPHWREDPDASCQPVENCEAGADNSIADRCGELHRDCIEASGDVPAHCGDCPAGTVENPTTQACLSLDACDSRDDCAEDLGLFCTQLTPSDEPQCRPAPCADGETWNRFRGRCELCPLDCTPNEAAGIAGQWPVSDRNGNCLCNTASGFFWDAAAATGEAVTCDDDGDGWVNEKIFQVLQSADRQGGFDDFSLLLSVNCPVPEVDVVTLANEWGQALDLDVISDLKATGPVRLFETARNDRGGAGLAVVPAAVNTLTKTCGSELDDDNDNGSSDFSESQATTTGREWQVFFNQLTYFRELYSSTIDVAGRRLTIVEQPRFGASFPFHYFVDDDTDPAAIAADHWQCCTRRRDEGYDGDNLVSYDFAEYDCGDDQVGACAYTWPAQWGRTDPSPTAPPAVRDLPLGRIPSYDVCDADRVDPLDDVWRGMTHYSQFQCAKLVNATPTGRNEVRVSDVYTGPATPGATFNTDRRPFLLQQCSTAVDGTTSCAPETDVADVNAAAGQIAWLLKRPDNVYVDLADYTGGCIDEFIETPELCPGQVENPIAVRGDGIDGQFGELACGCGINYGGTDCEIGCPGGNTAEASALHYDNPTYTVVERDGFWSCVAPAASGFSAGATFDSPEAAPEQWSVTASVPLATGAGTSLAQPNPPACSGPTCGFTVR